MGTTLTALKFCTKCHHYIERVMPNQCRKCDWDCSTFQPSNFKPRVRLKPTPPSTTLELLEQRIQQLEEELWLLKNKSSCGPF